MQYCKKCDRWFQTAEALRQHRQDSGRHPSRDAFASFWTETTTPARPSTQTTTSGSGTGMAFPGWGASSVTQTARGTAGDDPSKHLISSLKGYYNHFHLVVPPSLEFAGADNGLRIGSTPAGSTQIS
jgi:hypothetical protein